MDKNKKILIATTSFGKFDKGPLDLIEEKGFSYIINPYRRKLKSDEIILLGKDVIGIIAGTESLTDEVFSHLSNLRAVSRCGVGMDNVDIEALERRKIKFYNTPDAPTRAVSELTVGVILDLLRKVGQMDRIVRDGGWEKKMGNLLYGKKVGIIGFGRIGQKVSELLSGFSVELSYYDIENKVPPIDCSKKEFEEILSWADIISLHLSLSKGSEFIIGEKEINLMKKGGFLINLSRGGIIDEEALYRSLKSNHLSGAALDVFKEEPYRGHLRELDNVILTPHIGSYAREVRVQMEKEAVRNLLKGL